MMFTRHSRSWASSSPRQPRTLLFSVLLGLCALADASSTAEKTSSNSAATPTATTTSPTSSVTTAPIYLPHYNNKSWDPVRGSILSSNATANETTYTIFCPVETPPACSLNLEFPFIIVNGPQTVRFQGTVTSSFTADLGCELEGTVAATCSGYTSFNPTYFGSMMTESTVTNWTSTLTGTEAEWGTLTLVDLPATTTDKNGASAADTSPAQTSNEFFYTPQPTGRGAGRPGPGDMRVMVAGVLGCALATSLLF